MFPSLALSWFHLSRSSRFLQQDKYFKDMHRYNEQLTLDVQVEIYAVLAKIGIASGDLVAAR